MKIQLGFLESINPNDPIDQSFVSNYNRIPSKFGGNPVSNFFKIYLPSHPDLIIRIVMVNKFNKTNNLFNMFKTL